MTVVINGSTGITFPAGGTGNPAGTVVGTTDTQALTNKSFDSASVATVSGTAPLYMARAWVNFNGTGVVAIRASGNVSSITDNGTGNYTANFSSAMPDTNYATIGTGYTSSSGNPAFTNATRAVVAFSNNSSSCRIQLYRSDINSFDSDSAEMNVAVFR